MRTGWMPSAVMIGLLLLVIQPVAGQATRPSADQNSVSDQAVNEQKLLRVGAADSKPMGSHGTALVNSGTSDLSRIALGLLVVIGVIVLLRAGVARMANLPGSGRSGKLVTVLSRSVISPRQQVLVLQVGKRLIVVGDSAGRMNSLCEISDPDEVAMLIGQTNQAKSAVADRAANSFRNLFGKANEPFEEVEAMQPVTGELARTIDPHDAVSGEEVRGLLDKVRMLQQQFKA